MKGWLYFFVPFVLVSGIGVAVGTYFWLNGTPCESYEPVEFFDVDASTRCVRVHGVAHYEVVVTQVVEGNGFFDDRSYYVYGLFPKGAATEREIRVLVRSEREPERFVSFEEMTLEGKVLPMDYRKIPFDTESRMGDRGGYWFNDLVVMLEPDRIEVDGEDTWVRPGLRDD
jgi:hypothetical protein